MNLICFSVLFSISEQEIIIEPAIEKKISVGLSRVNKKVNKNRINIKTRCQKGFLDLTVKEGFGRRGAVVIEVLQDSGVSRETQEHLEEHTHTHDWC